MRTKSLLCAVLLVLGTVASSSSAQPTQAEIDAAKKVAAEAANKAFEDFNAGKYDEAIAGFQKADKSFHGLKFGLYIGRAQAKQGKLLFVAFGYTNCPDVCPTTLSDMKKAKAKLGADGDKVDMAFVTIDPERDTPDVIVPYLGSFAKSGGHPIRTTDADALAKAKDAFDVKSSVTKKPDGEVEVTHSARSFIVDDTGKVVVEWNFGTGSDGMAHDLAILLDRA